MARKRKKGSSSPPPGGGQRDIRTFFFANPRPRPLPQTDASLGNHTAEPYPSDDSRPAVAVASSTSGVGTTEYAFNPTAQAPAARRRLNSSSPPSSVSNGKENHGPNDNRVPDRKMGAVASRDSNEAGSSPPIEAMSVGVDRVSPISGAASAALCDAKREVSDLTARGRDVVDLTVADDSACALALEVDDPKRLSSSRVSPRRRRVQSTLTTLLLSPKRPKVATRQPSATLSTSSTDGKVKAEMKEEAQRRPLPIPAGSALAAPPDPSNPNDHQRLFRIQFERDVAPAIFAAVSTTEVDTTSSESASSSATLVNAGTSSKAAAGGPIVDAPASSAMEVTTAAATVETSVRAPEVFSSPEQASPDTRATTLSTATMADAGKPSVESVDEDPFGSVPDDCFVAVDQLIARSSGSFDIVSDASKAGAADREKTSPNGAMKASGDDHDLFGGIADANFENVDEHWIANSREQREHAMPPTSADCAPSTSAPGLPLSAEQLRVATFGPNAPLSVRAGAGSGKTHTMVARAVNLYRRHGVDPSRILMLTYTNRAAREMERRVAKALLGINGNARFRLPTVKTFHSLAFSWIKRCWGVCGMARAPTILSTDPRKRAFMKTVLEARLDELRLERCRQYLGLRKEQTSSWSWDDVIEVFQSRYPAKHKTALVEAEAEAEKKKPPPPTKKRKKKGTTEEGDDEVDEGEVTDERIKADLTNIVRSELRKCVYMQLLRLKKGKDGKTVSCDLAGRWKGDKDRCNFYLDLVRNARLRGHKYSDYLPEDGRTWQLYEEMQVQTGNVDFDKMLNVFVDLLRTNTEVNRRFRERHCYVIVDEYQDNSEVQSDLLLEIVTDGRVTVVGDDDQCIYEFRGASPGNFDRFREHYSALPTSSARVDVNDDAIAEEVLVDNYRSTGNILRVGSAFLERCSHRDSGKVLRPTKEDGEPVEIWTCESPEEQVERIVAAIRRRHDNDGVPWGGIACLFRCSRMGSQGLLYRNLETKLAACRIPYVLACGNTIFERAAVKDVMAYAALTLTGRRGHVDDDAFVRVLNRPCRRLPNNVLEKIREHRSSMDVTPPVGLEEAAVTMYITGVGLSASQRDALKEFFELLNELRVESTRKMLPELIKFIWNKTKLDVMYAKEKVKKKSKKRADRKVSRTIETQSEDSDSFEEDFDEGKSDNVEAQEKEELASRCASQIVPPEVDIVIDLAQRHVEDWIKREDLLGASDAKDVSSLFHLARKCVIQRVNELPELPQNFLPQHLLDELHLPEGIGPPIVSSFLTDIALQMSLPDDHSGSTHNDCVTISTIHRAKGLEWTDVFVPYFNEGYMPTEFREEDSPSSRRHRNGCDARDGGRCNRGCTEYFNALEVRQRGSTPEERHVDEERRLAHVAATRAKDRLVFVSLRGPMNYKTAYKKSTFELDLAQLPQSVVKIEKNDEES